MSEIRQEFSEQFCSERMVTVEFLGVWDTVGALLGPAAERRHVIIPGSHVVRARHAVAIDEFRAQFKPDLLGSTHPGHKEVWFAGAHSDVGGQYNDDRTLSNYSLHWIVREAKKRGLLVDQAELDTYELGLNGAGVLHDSLTGWLGGGKKVLREIPVNAQVYLATAVRAFNQNIDYEPENILSLEGKLRVVT